MKPLIMIVLLSLATTAFSAAPPGTVPGTPRLDPNQDKMASPAEPQKQEEAQQQVKISDQFPVGPYLDGNYQFWGKDDLQKRDEREEEGQ